jgi:excisionase family DNA binding protein
MYTNQIINNKNSEIDKIEYQISRSFTEIMKHLVYLRSKNQSVILQNQDNQLSIQKKEILTLVDLVEYSGLSKSSLYKMTMNREIPHYKVNRKLYFNYEEIKNWFLSNKIETKDEIRIKIRNVS